jgi:hypothetical protein
VSEAMTDTFAKDLNCILCEQSFSPVTEAPEDKPGYPVHCTACSRWVHLTRGDSVRIALREVLNIEGDALALAVQTYLTPCICGNPFSHDAGGRCPACIRKIQKETKLEQPETAEFRPIWNISKMKDELEGRFFEFIVDSLDAESESLNQLVERYESGQVDPGTYMEKLEELRFRESREFSVIKSWAMLAGPEMAYRAAEEHLFTERYGTRVLISIAQGIEMGYGTSILTSLSKEEKNLDGPARKEIQTFIKKIAGGF